MQGRTPPFSASGDPEGDEEVYEATLTDSRMPLMVCLYWTLKLKARFLFGDLAGALEALRRARRLVRSFVATIGQLDYSFYSALTVTALFESGSDEERSQAMSRKSRRRLPQVTKGSRSQCGGRPSPHPISPNPRFIT
jgi:hypothetical protein